jgi:hypothetical protein
VISLACLVFSGLGGESGQGRLDSVMLNVGFTSSSLFEALERASSASGSRSERWANGDRLG